MPKGLIVELGLDRKHLGRVLLAAAPSHGLRNTHKHFLYGCHGLPDGLLSKVKSALSHGHSVVVEVSTSFSTGSMEFDQFS